MNNHAPEAVPAQLTEAKGTSLVRELFKSNFWMSGLAILKYIPRSFRVKAGRRNGFLHGIETQRVSEQGSSDCSC
jgi:hypothetical protein